MSITVSLQLDQRIVYIIGGGKVAYRKAVCFLQEGAKVYIIAKHLDDRFAALSDIHLINDVFSWEKVTKQPFLMYAATNDEELNHSIIVEAKQRNILCGSANYNDTCDFFSMAQEQYDHLQCAISTKGACPGADQAFLKMLKEPLHEMEEKVIVLKKIREQMVHKKGSTIANLATLSLPSLLQIEDSYRNHKKVIVCAYHGIANMKEAQSTLQQMQDKIHHAFPDYIVMMGFLSNKIWRKANQRGFQIDEISTLMDVLLDLQIDVFLQPMLLQCGTWFSTLSQYQGILGDCLLSTQEDEQNLYDCIKAILPNGKLLAVYHDAQSSLFQSIKIKEQDQILPLSKLTYYNKSSVQVVPLFLLLGHHAKYDILMHISNTCAYHKKGLLTYTQIQDMFIKKMISCINLERNTRSTSISIHNLL